MSKRIFNQIDKYINEEEPEIEELNEYLEEIIVNDEISPTDKTILTRYSKVKKYLREQYGSDLSEAELKKIKPPSQIVDNVLESDKKVKEKKINIKFNQNDVDKILDYKNSKNLFELFIFLQFISGRRMSEIKEFEHNLRLIKNSKNQIKMKLAKKQDNGLEPITLIDNTISPEEFKIKVKKIRDMIEDISTNDFNKRLNRFIKKNINKNWSSHILRGMYGRYMFDTQNPENLNINGYLKKVLNHDSSDSSLSYSNFVFEK